MKFDINLGMPPRGASQRDESRPLKVLVISGFAGMARSSAFAPQRVDLDNFDAVMTAMKPRIELALAGLGESRLALEFATLEDFHPDALFRSGAIFTALRDQRARLADPATFQQAAAALLDAGKSDTFERLLGSSGREAAAPQSPQGSVVQKLIGGIVAPHVVPDIAPDQDRYIASVDAAIAALMRDILHAPEFQALESAWRGARALLDDTDGSEDVQLWLLDANAKALRDDLARSAEDPARSATFDILVGRAERAPDAEPWSIVIGDHLFGPSDDDVGLLATLGAMCRRAGAIFIGGADRGSLTAGATPGPWQMLRGQPCASAVALAAPRTLARLPYGQRFDAIDSFAFEELGGAATHESFLWGNSAFTLGRLLIRGFVARGWDMEPGDELELPDLPAVVLGHGDERKMQACAEEYIGEKGGERLLNLGLVPVLSYEGRPAVRLMRVQSIAAPAAALCFAPG